MKKTLLLFLLLIPFLGGAQALNGDYIINSTNADVNFRTLTAAITAVNSRGVSGPVRFLLDQDQTVTSQIVINQLTGSSAVNTLTIAPNSGKTIIISGSLSSSLIALNGADNIRIDGNNSVADNNLRINNTYNASPENDKAGISLYNNADNNIIRNLTIQLNIVDTAKDVFTVGIHSGGSTLGSSGNNSTNTVSKVVFTGVSQAVYINGNTDNNTRDWTISNCTIGSSTLATKPSLGIYLNNVNTYSVNQNTISGIRKNSNYNNRTAAGVISLGSSTGTISNNFINDIVNNIFNNGSSTAGIYINTTSATSVYNNIVSNVYNTTTDNNDYNYHNKGQGIFVQAGSSTNIFYNTIVMNYANAGAYSSCLYIANGTGLSVRNNIFYNSQTSGTQYTVFSAVSLATINYNDHYVTNNASHFSGKVSGNNYTTLASWRTATGQEGASKNFLPVFLSDYHLNTTSTVNDDLLGQTIASVTSDIDGEARTKPYMGADEIVTCTPTGDQTSFGVNSWIGYVYNWTGATPNPATPTTLPISSTSTYIGTITENRIFDRSVGTGQVNGLTRNITCDTPPSDYFFVRYKMQTTTTAGTYNFTIGGDDGVRLYIDGTLVNVTPTTNYSLHSYVTYAAQVNLTAGTHNFILEYYENDGSSRVAFSYGEIKGDVSLPYGDNKWNAYGFSVANIALPSYAYAGLYVDNNVNINTQTFWTRTGSPSDASSWQGAPIGVDQFTLTLKRQGFPCGRYQIQLVNCDDVGEIYIDGTKIFTQSSYTGTSTIINGGTTYQLNKNSKVEVRLREDGGDANIAINFIDTPTVYNGSGSIASDTSIRISANTTLGSDLQVCSCTVDTGVTFAIPANRTLTVDETITVNGTGKLQVQNNGSLLQTNTAATAYSGTTTSFELLRNTAPVRRYDFTYWSSPVTLASNFTLAKLSPATLGDKYYSYDPNTGWIINYNGTQIMAPGQGYIVRAPQTYNITTPAVYTASFIGVPNNGDITVTPAGNRWNLMGNPYPSALDADKLMAANSNVGSLYFWTHNSAPSSAVAGDAKYNYTANDYAVYNLTGGTGTSTGSPAPTGKIASGQAFFFVASTSNPITFTNNMRLAGNNNQFFKTAATAKNRIWLNFANAEGAFKQTLVGYMDGATNNWDTNYDAMTISGNTYVDFYSINNSTELTIQGRSLPFENSDLVPLGYKTTVAGEFTIAIDHVDGLFKDQGVYLEDKTTNTIYDLKTGDYKFKTEAGTFGDRFVLRYTGKTLGTDDFENFDNELLVSVKNKVIKLTSTENIKDVTIYDISGRLLYGKDKVGTTELQISNLQSSDQILLVKVILENNHTMTKKVIFK
ncbi:T9SS sorting signal type C domain-containing protein [Flavobacterium sp.]|uniref:T9SS sorting signal type C domain-containing protein n=1 Tax=Flavobacterium sp. TaxID=239 RepID=UPI0031E16C8D